MSKTVDERVVSMQFDNRHFENNVQTTMSTLDKLKQKLNLDGAGKSLENLNASARKVDMSGLGRGIETVHAKFSALEVMGVTALANITNSAVNAGKKMISALTIDPIKTGFQEYETQINAVQTILANTKSKGSTIDDVNKALDELNKYADLTIYNFTEMTRNIGTFTAAGIDLETSVSAIQGIANLAAVSGSTSQQASTAMYQLSQALAAGTVKLMDWNSVVNAGMGGEVFQNALKKTSELLGTGAEAAIKAKGSFRESLQTGWLTSEVLTETLKKFTTSGANEYVAEYTGLSKEAVQAALDDAKAKYGEADAIEHASKALAEKSGKNADEIKSVLEMADTATQAATKVKTFTQLWDVLKEAVQSGWAQTWRLIFGDFEQAKSLFTPIADFLTGIISKISDMRNAVLESALGKSFASLKESISGILDPIKNSSDSIKEVIDSVKDYTKIVDEIVGGKWGNGQERWDKLTKAGYDWAHAQNLVNEKLGDATRHATNYKEAQDKVTESDKKSAETKDELSKADAKRIEELTKLSDAELKNLGYQDDQIKSIRQIQTEADKLGMSVSDFISHIDELDGRWILIDAFKNIGQSLVEVFKAVGQAWREVFYGNASDEQVIQQKANSLYNLIAAFHKLSENLKVNKETADQIKRTFKGLFAILDIVRMVVGGGLSIAFKVLKEVLGLFNVGILEATANVGDAIVAFRDWIKEHDLISKGIKITAKVIYTLIIKIGELAKKLYELPEVQKVVTKVSNAFTNLFDNINSGIDFVISFVDKLKEMDGISLGNIKKALGELLNIPTEDVGKYIAEGLVNGIKTFGSIAIDTIVELGKGLLAAIKAVLGIHSPSTEFFEIGVNIILGLINGIISGAQKVISTIRDIGSSSIDALQNSGIDEGLSAIVTGIKNFAKKVVDIIKSIDFGTLFAMAISVGMIVAVKKMADVLEMFAAPLAGLGDMFSGIGKMFVGLGKNFKAAAFEKRTKGIYNIAKAIAVLAASIFLLSSIQPAKLWNSVGAITALAGVIVALSIACEKISNASVVIGKDGAKVKSGLNTGLLAIAGSLLILAYAVKIMGSLNPDQAKQGFIGLVGLVVAIGGVFAAYGTLVKGKAAQNIDKAGKMLLKMSVALLILVGVAKLISGMTWEDMSKAAVGITGLVGVIALLMTISMIPGKNVSKVGSMLLKISGTMLILVFVAKMIAGMEWADMGKAAIGMLGLISIIGLLVTISTIPGKNMDQVGGMLIKISGAMLILTITAKMLADMEWADMGKAAVGLLGLAGIIAILIKITQLAGNDAPKIAATLLAMSVAIGILAGVAIILSLIDLKGLAKGITAVGMLSAMMALMIVATRGANECKGNLIVMTVAIGMMAVAIAALSLIDGSKLAGATAALASVMGIFALMTYVAGQAKGSIGTLIVLTAAIGIIGGMLYLLSTLPVEDTIGTATALSILMLAVSGSLAIISKFASNIGSALSGVLALTAMAVPLLAFVGVLALMQNIQVATTNVFALTALATAMTVLLIPLTIIGNFVAQALLGVVSLTAMAVPLLAFVGVLALMQNIQIATDNVLSLIVLSTAMTALLIPLSIIGNFVAQALLGVVSLTAMALPLVAFVGVLALMQDVQNATTNVLALTILASALTLLLIPLTIVGSFIAPALLGVLSLTAMALPLVAFVGVLALMQNIQNATENANLLITLMNAIANVLVQVALVAPLALIGVTAIAGLTGLMVAIGVLATGVGALMQQFPALESFIDTGIPILEKLAYGIGSLVGNLVNGFATGVAEGLPQIGLLLSQFMTNAMPFINGVKMVDETVLAGVGILAGAILAFTAADLITGVASIISGGSSFATLGTELSTFITNAMPFINGVKAVDPTVMEGVKSLAGAILALTAANVLEGLTSWLTGGTSLADFGAELAEFGPSMKTYSDAVKGIDNEAVATSAQAAKNLAEMAKTLPNEGGLLGKIFGENNMDTFGTQLSSFGKSLKSYSEAVTGIQTEPIYASVEATKALAKMADSIPNLGGVVGWFVGDNSLATFGTQLSSFGRSLKSYSITVTGLQTEPIYTSVEASKALSSMASSIPKLGGVVSWFTGDNSLSTFGTQLTSFGKSLKSYSLSVVGINVDAINQSVSGAKRLTSLANAVPKSGLFVSDDLANFAKDIKPFGSAIKAYSDSVAGINVSAISNSVNGAKSIVNFINSLSSLNTSGIASFKTALTNLSTTSIKGFIDAFKNASSNLNVVGSGMLDALINGMRSKQPMIVSTATATLMLMVTAIKTKSNTMTLTGVVLMTSLLKGISSQEVKVSSTISKFANTAISSIRDKRKGFVSAGEYIASGLIVGMNNKSSNVYKAAQSLAQQALKAIEDTHVINSPGKKDIELGEYIGEGTAIGIENKEGRVYDAAETVADAALDALKEGSEEALEAQKESEEESVESTEDYWDRIIAITKEGSKENIESELETAEALRQNRENILNSENDYWNKLLEIRKNSNDGESYKKVKLPEFESDILDKTLESLKNYADEFQSTTDSLMNSSGIFDEVQKKEKVSAETLTKNLQDQVNQMSEFKNVMESLTSKLDEGSFKDTITQMGVDSLAELQALNGMSEEELNNYVKLFDDKYALCQQTAAMRLSELRAQTELELSDLYGGANVDLETFAMTFDGTFASIDQYVKTAITSGSQIAAGYGQGIKTGTKFAKESAQQMIADTETAAKQAAQIQSPSKRFENNVGTYISQGVGKGINNSTSKSSITSAVLDITSLAITEFRNHYEEFFQAGEYCADGFKEGILAKAEEIGKAAARVAKKALAAAKKAVDSHSPSKKFMELGENCDEGFIIGLENYSGLVEKQSAKVARGALGSLSNTISRISDTINSNMDAQPTIRPVLDLSGVADGVGAIDGMFNANPTLGVMSNIKSINSIMNNRQNGGNDDIISAIRDLKNTISNASGDVYNVNGITYDDGSNISSAIKDLVNAAKVERRI